MNVRTSLLSFFLGVVATAIVAAFALYGRDLHWQREAFDHHAGCYYWLPNDEKIYWSWADDYHAKTLRVQATACSNTDLPKAVSESNQKGRKRKESLPNSCNDSSNVRQSRPANRLIGAELRSGELVTPHGRVLVFL
jgi:hypothetical protein